MSMSDKTSKDDLPDHPNSHQSQLVPDFPSSIFPNIRHSPITHDQHSHGRPQTANHISQHAITTKASRTHWTLFDPGRITEASDTSDDVPLESTTHSLSIKPPVKQNLFLSSRRSTPPPRTRVTTLTMTESTAYMHRSADDTRLGQTSLAMPDRYVKL